MAGVFASMQREAGEGGSVYLRLDPHAGPAAAHHGAELQRDITEGAYRLREPGPTDIVIAYTGAVAPRRSRRWASSAKATAMSACWR